MRTVVCSHGLCYVETCLLSFSLDAVDAAGKSLVYQLPAILCCGITVCVSPLVSLIQDQARYA